MCVLLRSSNNQDLVPAAESQQELCGLSMHSRPNSLITQAYKRRVAPTALDATLYTILCELRQKHVVKCERRVNPPQEGGMSHLSN